MSFNIKFLFVILFHLTFTMIEVFYILLNYILLFFAIVKWKRPLTALNNEF
jgi:hypothetical protein